MGTKKTFFHYVIPSVGSSMVTALYFVVDGIFVGRGVGENALAAINIALPFIILVISCTMMLTMGGATLTSISFGQKDIKAANKSFRLTLQMVLIFAVLSVLLGTLLTRQIALISGASAILLADTITYLRFYSMFGIFYCLAMSLAVFVRNDGNPRLALIGMTAGAIINIFFDWLFIFPLQLGLMGAAIASGIGQAISCLILLTHFIRKKGQLRLGFSRFKAKICREIIRRGTPEFVTQMNQTVTILFYNILALRYLGEIGVSGFAIVCYLMEIIIACFLGVSQGIQPLISESFGAGQQKKERTYLRLGLGFNVGLSLLVYLLLVLFGRPIISIFCNSPALIDTAYQIVVIYGICFVFAAINIVFTTYNLAIKKTGLSLTIAIARSFVLNSILIFALPAIFGSQALWVGIILAELLVSVFCFITRPKKLLQNSNKKQM